MGDDVQAGAAGAADADGQALERYGVVLRSDDVNDLRQMVEQLAHLEGGWDPNSHGAKVLARLVNHRRLVFWGSDCSACEGYTTPESITCDECGARAQGLWTVQAAAASAPKEATDG